MGVEVRLCTGLSSVWMATQTSGTSVQETGGVFFLGFCPRAPHLPGELAFRKTWAISRFSPGFRSHEEASGITSKRSSRMDTPRTRSGRGCGLNRDIRPTGTDCRGSEEEDEGGGGEGAAAAASAAPLPLPPSAPAAAPSPAPPEPFPTAAAAAGGGGAENPARRPR